jgi:hypothetical protein
VSDTETPSEPVAAIEPLTLTVTPVEFAESWAAVARACSDDESRPTLMSMQIEVQTPTAIRLVATDSYQLYTSVVGTGFDINDLRSEPASTLMVDPEHKLMGALVKRLLRAHYGETVTLTIGAGLHVQTKGGTSLFLPAADDRMQFPDWRKLMRNEVDKAADARPGHIMLGHRVLGPLTQLAERADCEGGGVTLRFRDPLAPVYVSVNRPVAVRGLIMPIRPGGAW